MTGPPVAPSPNHPPPPVPELEQRLETCPLCASASIAPYDHDFNGRGIDRCSTCGLGFLNPRYTDESIERLYANYHHEAALTAEFDPCQLHRKRRELAAFAERASRGRCLSIGCGDGLEMSVARELGLDVQGFDIDPGTARLVGEHFGFETSSGDLLTADLPAAGFRSILCDQVLEHVKDPRAFVRRMFELLAPGGVAYVGVPNLGSLSNRFKTLTGRVGLRPRGRRGKHYDTWHHINYFSPRCLRHALETEAGFEIVGLHGNPRAEDRGLLYAVRHRVPFFESSIVAHARRPRL